MQSMLNVFTKKDKIMQSALVLLSILCFVISPIHATGGVASTNQEKTTTVNGVVKDSNGESLIGATVTIKGTTQGTTTDIDGKYTIEVSSKTVLVYSYVGMETMEIPVAGKTTIDVVMQDGGIDLSEVVVIGYGKQSRYTVTSAIAKVESKDLSVVPTANAMSMLQGKVAGMEIRVNSGQPGSDPQIILRGGTTTSPESDGPMIIIDGAIRTIRDVNYQDVETIQVLKDAASTAIYGSKASNGIVIITTKKGKSGKGRINFSYGLSIDQQAKKYPLSNAREYLTATRISAMNLEDPQQRDRYLSSGGFAMTTSNKRNSLNTTAFLDDYIKDHGQSYVSDLLYNQGWEIMEDPANPGKMLIFKDTNFQDQLFQTAIGQNYALDFSGGNDISTYYMSFGYLDQDGIVVGSDYNRWSMMLNTSYKVRPNVTVKGGVNYTMRKTRGIGNENNVMSRASKMPPTVRQYYEDGKPAPGEFRNDFRIRSHEVYYQEKENKISRINLNAELDWEIIKGLHFTPMFSYYNYEGKDHNFERANEIFSDRRASANHNMDLHYQYDAVVNYTNSINNIHNFNLMAGTNFIYDSWFRMSGSGYGGASDYIETLNGTAPDSQKVSTTMEEKKMNSYFGRLTYDYNRRYLFSASIRYDGSSHFNKDNRFAAFPGVSLGWNMHQEKFWESLKSSVNNMKVRASWGKTGNDNLKLTDTQGSYSSGFNYLAEAGLLNTVLANGGLLWEETTSIDGGLDVGLFNGKVNLIFDVYHKKTNNRLLNEKLWSESGFSSMKTNFGSLITNGIEFQIDATPIKTKDFRWDTSFNFSFLKTYVDKLPNNGAQKNRTGGGIIFDEKLGQYIETGGFAEGERFGARYAFQMDGVYSTDEDAANAPYDELVSASYKGKGKKAGDAIWRDLDKNGVIDYRDMVFVGYIHPDKMGGFTNTFNYKNFTLRIATDFALGHVIDNQFRAQANANSRNNYATIHDVASDKMWHTPGDVASIPRYDVASDWDFGKRNHARPSSPTIGFSGGSVNTLYIQKGDYLAFREIALSYSFRQAWLNKLGVESADLTGAVHNLGYITAYDGLTPEVIGADAGKYPRPRQVLFSVKLSL